MCYLVPLTCPPRHPPHPPPSFCSVTFPFPSPSPSNLLFPSPSPPNLLFPSPSPPNLLFPSHPLTLPSSFTSASSSSSSSSFFRAPAPPPPPLSPSFVFTLMHMALSFQAFKILKLFAFRIRKPRVYTLVPQTKDDPEWGELQLLFCKGGKFNIHFPNGI